MFSVGFPSVTFMKRTIIMMLLASRDICILFICSVDDFFLGGVVRTSKGLIS